MSKLLRAGLLKLKKDKVFWTCLIISVALAAALCLFTFRSNVKLDAGLTIDDCLMKIYQFAGILAAVFCSLHIGTEYSDGVIRNKLVVGRTRTSIYLTNAILAVVANIIFNLAYMATVCILGIPLLGPSAVAFPTLFLLLATGILMTAAITSICTLISMLNQNKALVAVISIIGVFVLIFIASLTMSMLNAPEYYEDVVYEEDTGELLLDKDGKLVTELVANPEYLRGNARTFYQFVADFLPTGQALGLSIMKAENLSLKMVYSVIIIVASNVAGVVIFRLKDLK